MGSGGGNGNQSNHVFGIVAHSTIYQEEEKMKSEPLAPAFRPTEGEEYQPKSE